MGQFNCDIVYADIMKMKQVIREKYNFVLGHIEFEFYVAGRVFVYVLSLSRVRLFVTPWTVTRLLCPWGFPGKSTGVGCHYLLQGIFPTQGSNTGLLHCRQMLCPLSQEGNPASWKCQLEIV